MIIIKQTGEEINEALERTIEEKKKCDEEYQKPKTSDDKIDWFSIVTVIVDGYKGKLKCFKDYVNEYDENYESQWDTLGKVCKNFNIELDKVALVTVILERGLDGEIWQYGNYCDSLWHFHGETKGYA